MTVTVTTTMDCVVSDELREAREASSLRCTFNHECYIALRVSRERPGGAVVRETYNTCEIS